MGETGLSGLASKVVGGTEGGHCPTGGLPTPSPSRAPGANGREEVLCPEVSQ